jgi:F-type H+-transporting ATPase subunit b
MFASLLAAAETEAPLIDLDGTVLLQFAIFVTMVIVLHTLVFRPYLKVRQEREKGIGGAREEARSMEARAAAAAAEMEAKINKAKQRGDQERSHLRTEAAAHGRQVLGAAREAAQKTVTSARAQAHAEEQAARTRLLAETEPLAREAVRRILGRAV